MDLRERTAPTTAPASGPDVAVWRYADMCDHWGVSRATVERWVQRYETLGEGIPVHRDPSGRPYWLAHEASATADHDVPTVEVPAATGDLRLEQLRRAARRGRRIA